MPLSHDTVAQRLGMILTMLNEGQMVCIPELAEEFGVSDRTIQRDINVRLGFLPLEKKGKQYYLDEHHLGKYQFNDIKSFADFSGIGNLYPGFDQSMVSDIFNREVNKALKVQGHSHEDLRAKRDMFDQIGGAINSYRIIQFMYKGKQRTVQPYRLMNTNGIWYLVGAEEKNLKHYTFSKIHGFSVLDKTFEADNQIIAILEDTKSTWFTQKQIEVELFIDKAISEYFLRRPLLPHQTLMESGEDGLVLSAKIAYEEEILRIVRYWIPYIRILSPQSLQKRLEEGLKEYYMGSQI